MSAIVGRAATGVRSRVASAISSSTLHDAFAERIARGLEDGRRLERGRLVLPGHLDRGRRDRDRDEDDSAEAREGHAAVKRAGEADSAPDVAWEAWSKAIAEARSLGKIVVATGAAGMADIGVLLRMGVHYAQGEALSGWLAEWTFDFDEAVL